MNRNEFSTNGSYEKLISKDDFPLITPIKESILEFNIPTLYPVLYAAL